MALDILDKRDAITVFISRHGEVSDQNIRVQAC